MLATAMTGATLLSLAGGVFANGWGGSHWREPAEIEVKNEDIFVMVSTDAFAVSGWNDQSTVAKWGGDTQQWITTGTSSATAFTGVMAGYTVWPECDCFDGDVTVKNEDFHIMAMTDATAKSGGNDQWSYAKSWSSDAFQDIHTGNSAANGESTVMVGWTGWSVN